MTCASLDGIPKWTFIVIGPAVEAMEARARQEQAVAHAQGVAAAGQGLNSGHPDSRELPLPLTFRQVNSHPHDHRLWDACTPKSVRGATQRSIHLVLSVI